MIAKLEELAHVVMIANVVIAKLEELVNAHQVVNALVHLENANVLLPDAVHHLLPLNKFVWLEIIFQRF